MLRIAHKYLVGKKPQKEGLSAKIAMKILLAPNKTHAAMMPHAKQKIIFNNVPCYYTLTQRQKCFHNLQKHFSPISLKKL